jgi:beta-glucosidase
MSSANLNAGEENVPETGNELKPEETNDVKTYENVEPQTEGQTGEEPTGIKKFLQPKYLIPIIIGVVVVIVLIVVLCVVLIDDDDFDYSKVSESWRDAYKKANKFLKKFSLDEKVMLLYSTENLLGKCVGSIDANKNRKFPGICLQDGPAGVRFSSSTQSWQAAINTAATFDRELMYKVGAAQGKEFKDKGINIMLSPCMNILRNPLGGRIWEAFGEDPFLSGETAAEVIKGIQSQGVIACAKHFIGNEIEDPRHNSSTNIPEQALWEIYLEPFYKAVKKGDVASFMESYNAVNGVFMTKNKRLLQEILKDKIGFDGFVMSDWWSINSDSYEHFANGCDMNMPGGPTSTSEMTGKEGSWWHEIPNWIDKGYITKDRVDDACRRIIAAMFKLDQIPDSPKDSDYYPESVNLDKDTITSETKKLNREVGADSIVLLQNTDSLLPLRKNKVTTASNSINTLKIFGNSAVESECLKGNDCTCIPENMVDNNRYFTGYVGLGWGSGTTTFNYQITPLDAIKTKAEANGITVTSSTDLEGSGTSSIEKVPSNTDCSEGVNIVFIAANSGEEYIKVENNIGDRTTLDAWHSGGALADAVISCSGKKVLIILGPATVTIKNTWKTGFDAILFAGMLGGEGGNALTDVLFGEVVPSGHLPFVWAQQENYPNVTKTDSTRGIEFLNIEYTYNEGIYVGQKYFDKYSKTFDYAFGYGLSYTTFTFSGLSLKMSSEGLTVKFQVKNSGQYDGKVVPMVFLKFPISNYPEKVFKGFDKKLISTGSTSSFEILIDDHDLSYYDVDKEDFVRPTSGQFTVYVGENAKDDKLTGTVNASY